MAMRTALFLNLLGLGASQDAATNLLSMPAMMPNQAGTAPVMPQYLNAPMMQQRLYMRGSESSQFGQMREAPQPKIEYVYSATGQPMGLKKVAKKRVQGKASLDSKASIAEGRVPGADSYGKGEEELTNSGRFGLEARQAPEGRKGYGSEFYGPKKGFSSRKAPAGLLAQSDLVASFAALMIGLVAGAGAALLVFRLRRAPAAAEHPLLS